MNSFTKTDVIQLRNEIDAALATVAQKHGLIISIGNGRFSPTECRFTKLTIIPKNQSAGLLNSPPALATTLEGQEYLNLCYAVNLPKDGLGKKFFSMGKEFTIVGLRMSRRKYPVSATSVTGRRFKFTADQVRRGLVK